MNHNLLGEVLATALLGLQAYGAFEKDKATFIEPANLAMVITGFISVWHPAQTTASGTIQVAQQKAA